MSINFGGLNVEQKYIKEKKSVSGQNGEQIFIINFKNGSSISYPLQKNFNGSSIMFGINQNNRQKVYIDGCSNLQYNGIEGVEDDISVSGCQDCTFAINEKDISVKNQVKFEQDDLGDRKNNNNVIIANAKISDFNGETKDIEKNYHVTSNEGSKFEENLLKHVGIVQITQTNQIDNNGTSIKNNKKTEERIKKNFGGINIECKLSDVKEMKILEENGKEVFFVEFNNGSSLKYPKQKGYGIEKNPEIYTFGKMTRISYINNLEYKGGEGEDSVCVIACKNCTFDMQENNPKISNIVDFGTDTIKEANDTRIVSENNNVIFNTKHLYHKHNSSENKNGTVIDNTPEEPIYENFGGIKFVINEIASKNIATKKGVEYYTVEFKNGIKIKYPLQEEDKNASINTEYNEEDEEIYEEYQLVAKAKVYNAKNIEIIGSENRADRIELSNCKDCKVDIDDDALPINSFGEMEDTENPDEIIESLINKIDTKIDKKVKSPLNMLAGTIKTLSTAVNSYVKSRADELYDNLLHHIHDEVIIDKNTENTSVKMNKNYDVIYDYTNKEDRTQIIETSKYTQGDNVKRIGETKTGRIIYNALDFAASKVSNKLEKYGFHYTGGILQDFEYDKDLIGEKPKTYRESQKWMNDFRKNVLTYKPLFGKNLKMISKELAYVAYVEAFGEEPPEKKKLFGFI